MAARRELTLVTKAILVPMALIIAVASFVHAAAEAETLIVDPTVSGPLGLGGHLMGTLAEREYVAEMSRLGPQAQGQFPRLSESLAVAAKDSFAIDPLEVSSLRVLALGSILQRDEERARDIMRLAQKISKRDSVTNLWLAEDYAKAGDVEAMLASFDHALRTSSRVREFAMKPVVDSLASPQSHAPLGTLLAARPEWETDFWKEFARNPIGNANAAAFLRGNDISLDRLPEADLKALYVNLKKTGQYGTLFDLAGLDPQVSAENDALAAGKFIAEAGASPLGWTTRSDGSFAARLQQSTGELQIDARSGAFGLAADRIVAGGGNYRLVISMVEPVPDNVELALVMRCVDGEDGELGKVRLASGDREGDAVISADGCRFASLELSFAADPGRRDAFIRIASIGLRQV